MVNQGGTITECTVRQAAPYGFVMGGVGPHPRLRIPGRVGHCPTTSGSMDQRFTKNAASQSDRRFSPIETGVEKRAVTEPMQGFGRGKDGQVRHRLDQDDQHVGGAESCDLAQVLRA